MRADRLVSLVLLLQARGRTAASVLAAELEVSVRTIYRDLEALSRAGVPVVTEPGPGGGCQILDDYRFPLRGLRPEEAEALLILGVPHALSDLGLDSALAAAQRRIRVTVGVAAQPGALVHLDMPRWFGTAETVPELRTLAEAVRLGRQLRFDYRRSADATPKPLGTGRGSRVTEPLGLVNKAGVWYLVARSQEHDIAVFRASRISSAGLLAGPVERPEDFDLPAFWAQWSAEFTASRPRYAVTVRASPVALTILPEIFGDGVREALNDASEPDQHGHRIVRLSFEHEIAAAHRLAGFADLVEVIDPPEVRARLVATARSILDRYQ